MSKSKKVPGSTRTSSAQSGVPSVEMGIHLPDAKDPENIMVSGAVFELMRTGLNIVINHDDPDEHKGWKSVKLSLESECKQFDPSGKTFAKLRQALLEGGVFLHPISKARN